MQEEVQSVDNLKELIFKEKLSPPAIAVFDGKHQIRYKNLKITIDNGQFKVEKNETIIAQHESPQQLINFLKTYH